MGDIPKIQTRVDIEKLLNDCLRLFDAAISLTVCYAAGTWTPNKEHERMIQSTQRKMLRLIIETKRSRNKNLGPTKKLKKQTSMKCVALMMKAAERNDSHVDCEVSFEDDADEEIDTTPIEEEDWIEYIKRSTEEAMEKMESAKIRCWNKTHKK